MEMILTSRTPSLALPELEPDKDLDSLQSDHDS